MMMIEWKELERTRGNNERGDAANTRRTIVIMDLIAILVKRLSTK